MQQGQQALSGLYQSIEAPALRSQPIQTTMALCSYAKDRKGIVDNLHMGLKAELRIDPSYAIGVVCTPFDRTGSWLR
jgi:hypothetical protein